MSEPLAPTAENGIASTRASHEMGPATSESLNSGGEKVASTDEKKKSSGNRRLLKGFGGANDVEETVEDLEDYQKRAAEGHEKFHRLSWQRLTICLIVEAIALGALSMPSNFSTLGMVPGVICTVFLGVLATHGSLFLGEICLKFKSATHYDEVVRLMFGKWGKEIFAVALVIQLFLVNASHVLTGTELLNALSDHATCSVVFGVVSAVLLFAMAIPPSFHDFAILGYIDFVSILVAIFLTMLGSGLEAGKQPGGYMATEWRLWPKEGTSFAEAVLALTNIIFAYSFAVCLPSFMGELRKPQDYRKALISLGAIEITIYTLTGAIIYSLSGDGVSSPAIFGAGALEKPAWGVAIPVVYISGAINAQVACRYMHDRKFKGTLHGYFKTVYGWAWWLGMLLVGNVFSFVIAEVVPFFSSLLGIISALFISGFSYWLPGLAWFMLIRDREASIFSSKNLIGFIGASLCLIVGFFTLGAGTYASVQSIIDAYADGTVNGVFTCATVSA
ncbi:hypothetical protein IE81DRAFT_320368 [Ceraceosorus guamensis]|uniref:Amino acid transporter transmembrane domain-containing protein n=1 Tax=Ceraceosorus guamensis TaxID=1522189 RepID=A0A316W5Q0_9BASI|nr:hypothetical protein IE81DRAFT_320368 [Ceraceosorus guamensis]PWN45197.1 hypothetical protein IE81DRAFT_320368 [Ceraceosorus guamensis]